MTQCPNCGKVAGLHSSILQGCMCQYSMQAPPQRTWVSLTEDELERLIHNFGNDPHTLLDEVDARLKGRNT